MPITVKGRKILKAMREKYGPEKGEQVFYASINVGKLTGAEVRSARETARKPRRKRK